jgi:molybdopterin converting factor subunit 1
VEVTVRLFAVLRERAGAPQVTLSLPEGARVGDALAELRQLAGDVPLVMAVNREYASADTPLDPGDELALIPPVSGGATRVAPWVRVSEEPLLLDSLVQRVRNARAGAVVTFSGVTREVGRLHYEAYAEMAEERMAAIAADAIESHGLCAAAVEHRVGPVPLSEPSVIVAVSAPSTASRRRRRSGRRRSRAKTSVGSRARRRPDGASVGARGRGTRRSRCRCAEGQLGRSVEWRR